ncbi:ROK family protein [Vibrio kyushuensis]|uniref:ROK family protein n=1 Tax=Vibrio kyushuensis TaxID=2910249 RepID=UPI003D101814
MIKQQGLSLERKVLLFEQILDGYKKDKLITRKGLIEKNGFRPATVSQLLFDLIELNIVKEDMKTSVSGPGRPEVCLIPNLKEFNAVFVHIDSLTITASLVNLVSDVLFSTSVKIENRETSKEEIVLAIGSIVKSAIESAEPNMKICGVTLSLPGIVDRENQIWKYSNRWPNATNVSFESISTKASCKINLVKNLQSELNSFVLENRQLASRKTLYIHWGEGIGAATYDPKRMTRFGGTGLFSELGQTIIDSDGCTLEKAVSLAALRHELSLTIGCTIGNEKQCADQVKLKPLSSLTCLESATETFSRSLVNTYLTLFPDTIILTGPFVQNSQVFEELKSQFFAHIPNYCSPDIQLLVNVNSVQNELQGAISPFFKQYVNEIIVNGSHKSTAK